MFCRPLARFLQHGIYMNNIKGRPEVGLYYRPTSVKILLLLEKPLKWLQPWNFLRRLCSLISCGIGFLLFFVHPISKCFLWKNQPDSWTNLFVAVRLAKVEKMRMTWKSWGTYLFRSPKGQENSEKTTKMQPVNPITSLSSCGRLILGVRKEGKVDRWIDRGKGRWMVVQTGGVGGVGKAWWRTSAQ